jgi:hypothetical protein
VDPAVTAAAKVGGYDGENNWRRELLGEGEREKRRVGEEKLAGRLGRAAFRPRDA